MNQNGKGMVTMVTIREERTQHKIFTLTFSKCVIGDVPSFITLQLTDMLSTCFHSTAVFSFRALTQELEAFC